jgi:uncharacterized membrane protein HdeD (DUF308 family)
MSASSVTPGYGEPVAEPSGAREVVREFASLWWIWLILGICWVVASLVILQFNHASITTVGIITGILFTVSGLQQLALASVVDSLRWLWAVFGVLFLIAGVICFVKPADTFAGLADVLGFLFLCVGVWWMIRAFLVRAVEPTWWVGLIAGILMTIMAFWTSGQLFIHKAYVLLVFAGIWAMMHGVTEIVRAFQLRSLKNEL